MGTPDAELSRTAEADRVRMSETLDAIGDRTSPARIVERHNPAIMQRLRHAREAVMGSPDYQEPLLASPRPHAPDTSDTATEPVQGNPLAAGLVAFGIGALVATAFPKTHTEQRLVHSGRPQLDHAMQELREAGNHVVAEFEDRAATAQQELSSTVKDAASQVAEQTAASVQQLADQTEQSTDP
jgi:hypothetical protein